MHFLVDFFDFLFPHNSWGKKCKFSGNKKSSIGLKSSCMVLCFLCLASLKTYRRSLFVQFVQGTLAQVAKLNCILLNVIHVKCDVSYSSSSAVRNTTAPSAPLLLCLWARHSGRDHSKKNSRCSCCLNHFNSTLRTQLFQVIFPSCAAGKQSNTFIVLCLVCVFLPESSSFFFFFPTVGFCVLTSVDVGQLLLRHLNHIRASEQWVRNSFMPARLTGLISTH